MFREQDLGDDFEFEKDPLALASILNDRGLKPSLEPKSFQTSLTPASKLSRKQTKLKEQYDFFEGKNGMVFFRPSAKFSAEKHFFSTEHNSDSMAYRGMKKRMHFNIKARRVGHSGPARRVTPAKALRTPLQAKSVNTEEKLVPFVPLPHRQSISERKAIPGGGTKRRSFLPKPMAMRSLKFGGNPRKKDSDEENVEFAKPNPPLPGKKGIQPHQQEEGRSKAELILMREGLMGLPRESMSFLLRQSMTPAELDRMFEDDSTQSFEALEKRFKTPKKPVTNRIEVPQIVVSTVAETSAKMNVREVSEKEQVIPNEETEDDAPDNKDDGGFRQQTVLSRAKSHSDLMESEQPQVKVLLRSTSEVDLSQKEKLEVAEMLNEAQNSYQEYIKERECIEREMKKLMMSARRNKETFKMAWGVSPAKINSLRHKHCNKSVMLNLTKVQISREVENPISAIEDKKLFAETDRIFSPVAVSHKIEDSEEGKGLGFKVVEYESTSDEEEDEDFEEEEEDEDFEEEEGDDDDNFEEVDMEITPGCGETKHDVDKTTKSVSFVNTTPEDKDQFAKPEIPAKFNINIPLHVKGKVSHIQVSDQLPSKQSHIDTPRHLGAKSASSDARHKQMVSKTPMELRALSLRAQQELQLLYKDQDEQQLDEEDTKEEETSCLKNHDRRHVRGVIDFDED